MDNIYSTLFGIFANDWEKAEKVGRDKVNGYTIDTCYTVDAGWETAVWYKGNPMVIVARYPDKEMAAQGHNEWVDTCTTNRPTHAFSVQTDRIESFMGE
jgi:hypothetical protein